jgi:putative transposase
MLKTFKYRIYPTKSQIHILKSALEECRWLYNYFLEQRKSSWEEKRESIGYYDQAVSLPKLKQKRESLSEVYSQVLQNVAMRVDLAFKAFFRRVKTDGKPGYPRFKGKGRYDSVTYPQMGFELTKDGLKLSRIGMVKIKLHRMMDGEIKTCTIQRTSTGKWFACLSVKIKSNKLRESRLVAGIDVGLENFATLSNEERIENPRFFRADEQALAKAQRKKEKTKEGTPARHKAKKVISRIHERTTNRRSNFAHQESRKLVNRFGILCIEDLKVNRMVHNHCLSKSILDAAWSQFAQFLAYKAENAGRQLVWVNPAYTSQDCARCGHREVKKLSERLHQCPCCGFNTTRDHNAALNILRLGLQSLGIQSVEALSLKNKGIVTLDSTEPREAMAQEGIEKSAVNF